MEIIDGKLHEYLGDEVYACYDGSGMWLRANDHREYMCTDKIYLEPYTIEAINRFFQNAKDLGKEL